MNLCGAMINVTEPEMLLLEIPDEKYNMTPRRKAASSMPSRRKKGTPPAIETGRRTPSSHSRTPSSTRPSSFHGRSRQSTSVTTASPRVDPSPTFLNPISKDQMRKSRSRQSRPQVPTPVDSVKSSSKLIAKLEAGFTVGLLSDTGNRGVVLDLDQDKAHLRIRATGNDPDNENDGFKSNSAEIRLKVREIARLEVGRVKIPNLSGSASPKPVKCFTIGMKRIGGELLTTYNFEADSLVQRDTIVASIKYLLEQAKQSSESRRRCSTSQSPMVGGLNKAERRNPKSSSRDQSSSRDHGLETRVEFFDFDFADGSDVAIEAGLHRKGTPRKESHGTPRNEQKSRRFANQKDSRSIISDDFSTDAINNYAVAVVSNDELHDIAIEVAGKEWSNLFCGANATKNLAIDKPSRPKDSAEKAIQSMKKAFGCQSEALAAVEDVELAHMAANQVGSPWCTDDVCGASLNDLTDTMKGIFEMKQKSRESLSGTEKQRLMAEDYITGVLGAPATMANLISVKDIFAKTPSKVPTPKVTVIKNRSSKSDAPATHLCKLRNQMTFMASEDVDQMPFVQIISSFDDISRGHRFAGKSSASQRPSIRTHSGSFDGSDSYNIQDDVREEVLYYDSDPEDYRERSLRSGPRRAIAERRNKKATKTPRREALSGIASSRYGPNRRWKRLDEDVMSEIIDTLKNERMTLMWHPNQTKTDPSRAPVCVKAWVESGVYLLDGTFLLPKLTWIPAHEKSIQSKKLNVSQQTPNTIDLLDVCRVRECTTIDRDLHPFAKPDCSFIVQTQKGKTLFEAQSKQERGRIVNGLRLVIARLASLLMLRDLRAVDEFFGGNSVPGEAPSWACGKNEKGSDSPSELP